MRITRRLEFDAGHRIPDHGSQCKHLHGHRYVIEISLEGKVINAPGNAANGMVMDFGEIKRIAWEKVVSQWDHAFLVWREDAPVLEFLMSLPDHKTVIFDAVPTVENLAAAAFRILDAAYRNTCGNALRLERVRLFETPNCWADATSTES
ncbi:MAG: 6-carboxytetrahydropterin synthase QueD [Azoarcus sp.]|jgi:6-pyruvoyltetrahydropterin/6-carboxytetrahydropterin synthase|nr:6-carboxytetrahydropterin synthase QueD [Azoarcus sp.]